MVRTNGTAGFTESVSRLLLKFYSFVLKSVWSDGALGALRTAHRLLGIEWPFYCSALPRGKVSRAGSPSMLQQPVLFYLGRWGAVLSCFLPTTWVLVTPIRPSPQRACTCSALIVCAVQNLDACGYDNIIEVGLFTAFVRYKMGWRDGGARCITCCAPPSSPLAACKTREGRLDEENSAIRREFLGISIQQQQATLPL